MKKRRKDNSINAETLGLWWCCGRLLAAGAICRVCGKSKSDAAVATRRIAELEPADRHALGKAVGTPQALSGITGKLRITITRGNAGRPLDHDNFVGGCKPLRDEIARLLGRDDAEQTGIEWVYRQTPDKTRMVEIEEIA